jgi:amidohydrolase
MDAHSIQEHIKKAAKSLATHLSFVRHHLHAHPELSFHEFATANFVEEELHKIGINTTRCASTGIVGLIEGGNPGKVVALRADLDALPIQEKNEATYASKNPGVMHACGHDVHTTCLLGAAKILYGMRDHLHGTVKLIFQPGEEVLPGGASLMIDEGVLENPEPDFLIAQHVFPSLPAGYVGFRNGMYMASTDELHVTVKGKPGHAAMPKDYVNPLVIAARVIDRLQRDFMEQPIALMKKYNAPTVLAFGKIEGLGATNVIPGEVKLQGTFRTMNEEWREAAHNYMQQVAQEIASTAGGSCEFRIDKGYPFLVNDDHITNHARAAAQQYLGIEQVKELELRMTAEDFAWFSQRKPVCFYRLGTASSDGRNAHGVHTPEFDVDHKSLEVGAGLIAWIAASALLGK